MYKKIVRVPYNSENNIFKFHYDLCIFASLMYILNAWALNGRKLEQLEILMAQCSTTVCVPDINIYIDVTSKITNVPCYSRPYTAFV